MILKILGFAALILAPALSEAEERVVRCVTSEKTESALGQGVKRLDPEGEYVDIKLIYENDELRDATKMPPMSRCKNGPSVEINPDYFELGCQSTLFKNSARYYFVNRFTGEFKIESVFDDGKLVSTGKCMQVKQKF